MTSSFMEARSDIDKLEKLGFARDLGDRIDAAIQSGILQGFHSILIMRSGSLAYERYFEGVDEAWGRPLGKTRFGREILHDLRSVTKSVVSLLYGIATDRGICPSPDASLLAQFPECSDLAANPQRASLKIVHALTMTMGLQWDESLPYSDPSNSEIMMESAKDRYRFILDCPIVAWPGKRWIYSGGCTALIGEIIARGANRSLADFARETLFADLGITEFEWAKGDDGVHSAASGLRLKPRDLARIGQLLVDGGMTSGKRVVSADWIKASFDASIATGDELQYGYGWYLGADRIPALGEPEKWMGAFGNGGQRLWLMPTAKLVVVSTAGAYNNPDQSRVSARVWQELVLPNLLRL